MWVALTAFYLSILEKTIGKIVVKAVPNSVK
jgi:hypothetical protein